MASVLDLAWDGLTVLKLFSEVDSSAPIDNLRAQKLTFLTELGGQKKGVRSGHMRFSRYKYGPYSWQLLDLLATLEAGGFIEPETRRLTKRGWYVLEYAVPELTGLAADTIQMTRKVASDYGHLSGPEITKMVYAMSVPIHDKGGVVMKIRPLPTGVDILNPVALPQLAEPVLEAEDVLTDLQREFGIPATALDPANPLTQLNAMTAISRALEAPIH